MKPRDQFERVGVKTARIDGEKLALGRGTFTADIDLPKMLTARILTSTLAHARIIKIDASRARALPGVVLVLTPDNTSQIPYTTAGQGHPEPSPYDSYMLGRTVRFVGDRVAVVAAETPEIAERALSLIDVTYEELPAVFDIDETLKGNVVLHPETDKSGIHDVGHNIAARLDAAVGDLEAGLAEADIVLQQTYEVQAQQHCHIEPHIAAAWMDEDDRLVIRTATQVPFHVRRICARVLEIPVKRVRVIKPRIGGGFGGKQEILIEDLVGKIALETGRPVMLELTRDEEFHASRTRHAQRVKIRLGAMRDGRLTAIEMVVLENTGAYGSHSLTVMCVTGEKALSLYRSPNVTYEATAVYTNLPVAGAFRGYGAPQGYFALESAMDELADRLRIDSLELRRMNAVRDGDELAMSKALGEGKEGHAQIVRSCGLEQCIDRGKELIGWDRRQELPGAQQSIVKRGIGAACLMQGSAIAGIDMASVSLKMNEDGSFNLLAGATDIGTGADTMLAQIAAETLCVPTNQILVYSADTDMTPFDTGAYASSTTYLSGGAAEKAAQGVLNQIKTVGARMLGVTVEQVTALDSAVHADGKSVSYNDICCNALYSEHQHQIAAFGSHMSYSSPPPFACQLAEVEVDVQTGEVRVLKLVNCVDCGVAINPQMAEGQVEGAAAQALGWAICEEMPYDQQGSMLWRSFDEYAIFTATDMPEMITELIETIEPTGPYGAKAIAEIPIDGPAPAIANAIFNATGIRIRELPLSPPRVHEALFRGITTKRVPVLK